MSSGKSSPFESSMTDLMISLALIFMLLLASVMLQIQKQEESDKLKSGKTVDVLVDELTEKLKHFKVETKKDLNDPLSLIIVVGENDDTLKFNTREWQLDENDKRFINKIIPAIMGVVYSTQYRNSIDSIRIEGYTDEDGNDWDNLLLSQQRALSVLNHSTRENVLSNPKMRNFLVEKASVLGRGEIKKYLQETKKKSRRVEIKIKVKTQEQIRLEKELEQKKSLEGGSGVTTTSG